MRRQPFPFTASWRSNRLTRGRRGSSAGDLALPADDGRDRLTVVWLTAGDAGPIMPPTPAACPRSERCSKEAGMVSFRTAAVLASLGLAGVGPATAQEHSTNPATRRFEAGPC